MVRLYYSTFQLGRQLLQLTKRKALVNSTVPFLILYVLFNPDYLARIGYSLFKS